MINKSTNNFFQEELRLNVLRVLEETPEATQREIANQLNVSLGGVNYCIKAMVERGFIKLGNFARSEAKMGYAYYLTPDGLTEKTKITVKFLQRKMKEYELLKHEIELLKSECSKAESPYLLGDSND